MRQRNINLRYQVFRSQARALVNEFLHRQPEFLSNSIATTSVRMEPITYEAITASLEWSEGVALFPWEEVSAWKDKDTKGFDLSIWYGTELCGLCYASPRRSRLCIKVILLESNPCRSHPLKGQVASLALLAVDYYARMLGCREIEVQDPLAGARPLYEALGFTNTSDGRLVIQIDP